MVGANTTFTETIGAGDDVFQSINTGTGVNSHIVHEVNGFLNTPHNYFPLGAGTTVTRTGSGIMRITSGSPQRVPWDVQSGSTFFNNNNQNGAVITQTGGVIGGSNSFISGYTGNGGRINPGNETFQTAQLVVAGDFVLNAGGTYHVDLNGPQATDVLTVQDDTNTGPVEGTVTLGGTLEINAGAFVPVGGQDFTPIRNDGTDPVVGTFAGMASNAPGGGPLFVRHFAPGRGADPAPGRRQRAGPGNSRRES